DDAVDPVAWYYDYDGDGYGSPTTSVESCEPPTSFVDDDTDCDDLDDTIFPGATETCNGEDDDCDGETDEDDAEGVSSWYIDYDGDGYGAATYTIDACDQPSGYVGDDTDCDDAKATIYPDATETCNGEDDDCDGETDEDDAVDAPTWYIDYDGDDYGSDAYTESACEAPSGYVEDDTDCDDYDENTYPEADEICDGADNDCDGETDEDAIDAPAWYLDDDEDGYGTGDSTESDCDQPDGYVADDTDCDDTDEDIYPDAEEVCDGEDNDCDGDADEEDVSDPITWYVDDDDDGYGSATYTMEDCEQPPGFSENDSDCDDEDDEVHPDAEEACDGIDNDCNGYIDDDDPELASGHASTSIFYADADDDGYGSATYSTQACEQPSGYADNGDDCDDTDGDWFACGGSSSTPGISCLSIIEQDETLEDGTYWIDPDGYGPFEVTCDMTTDGGGWTAIPYEYDLEYGQQFTGGDGWSWLDDDFTLALSDDRIDAIREVSTEASQTYVGRCAGVISYYYESGDTYDYAFGFAFHDGSESDSGTDDYSDDDGSVIQDGCSGNGGEGGTDDNATIFVFETLSVPILNVYSRDNGDSGEYFGSDLTENPAWFR
ncbi:MAG: MopE-related protein, partial [Myxococcota bacterium]|nr:MopE-related protein [Myxococcota bacterium]